MLHLEELSHASHKVLSSTNPTNNPTFYQNTPRTCNSPTSHPTYTTPSTGAPTDQPHSYPQNHTLTDTTFLPFSAKSTTVCNPGYGGANCAICPAGTVSSGGSTAACTSCAADRSVPNGGRTACGMCITCLQQFSSSHVVATCMQGITAARAFGFACRPQQNLFGAMLVLSCIAEGAPVHACLHAICSVSALGLRRLPRINDAHMQMYERSTYHLMLFACSHAQCASLALAVPLVMPAWETRTQLEAPRMLATHARATLQPMQTTLHALVSQHHAMVK